MFERKIAQYSVTRYFDAGCVNKFSRRIVNQNITQKYNYVYSF